MTNHLRHPESEHLLRYADGELPSRQAKKVRSHLEACWQCRSELDQLQNVVGECVRYRKTVLEPLLPPPPAPWGDLDRGFDEIDLSLADGSWWGFLRRPLAWIPAVAAILAGFGVYYQLGHAPSVEASELLRKAAAAADSAKPVPARRVRIRTRRSTVIQVAGVKRTDSAMLEPMFRAAHYNFEDPLSARSYQQWRDQLPQKTDEVTSSDGKYKIKTSTPSGDLAEASLQLRQQDLHPVQGRLEFRNREWVEIEELAAEAGTPALVSSASPAPQPTLPAPESIPGSDQFRQPAPAATVGDELAVLVALHKLGADLGDPIEVRRAGGQILVAGVGVDPQRKRQVEEALGTRPNVVVRFSEAQGGEGHSEKPVRGETPANPEVAALQARIEKQIGGRANYERLAADVLDSSDEMMSRVYALRQLAERFPATTEPEMSAADRQVLRDLYRDHASALVRYAAEIEKSLLPVLAPLGAKARSTALPPTATWQADTEELFTNARRVEALLAVMLGIAPGESVRGDLLSQVLSGLAQLRNRAEAYGPAAIPEPRP
jgi:hypothetical protein